jgi:hypothetical protein
VLDTHGLVRAAAELGEVATSQAEVAVVNRFAKSEADAHGLRDEIAAIMLAGIPLVIAVRDDLISAWEEFLGEPGDVLPPEPVAICTCGRHQARSRPLPVGA